VNLRAFNPLDLDEMNRWYDLRGEPGVKIEMLPRLGFLAPGIAAGFLYQTDSALALVEGLVSNPEALLCKRAKALHLILGALTDAAKDFGFKLVIGSSKKTGPVALTLRQGFRKIGSFEMVVKEVA
jgi:hypothetical protein